MNQLHDLLDRASEPAVGASVPPTDDLARAHRALRRRRNHRTGLAALGVLAVVGSGYGAAAVLDDPDRAPHVASQPGPGGSGDLVAADVAVGPYTLTRLPADWEVRRLPGRLTAIVPPGSPRDIDAVDLDEAFVLGVVGTKPTPAARQRMARFDRTHTSLYTFGSVAAARSGRPGLFIAVPREGDSEVWEDVINTAEGIGDGTCPVLDLPPTDESARGCDTTAGGDGSAERLPAIAPVGERGFELSPLPTGWELQANNAHRLVLAPADGSTSDNPDVFGGKLVVTLDGNGLPRNDMTPTEYDGRTFYSWDDGGSIQVIVASRDGEPDGELRLQAPAGAFTLPELIELLDRVTVTEHATAGVG